MNNGKARIHESMGNIEISLPSKKNWFVLLFGSAWLGGWYFALVNTFSVFTPGDSGFMGADGFMIFWLIAWILGGAGTLFLLLWGYFGRERVEIRGGKLLLEKTIWGIGIKKRLDLAHVQHFRPEQVNQGMFGRSRWALWGLGPRKVHFDYGMKTYSFGLAVDDAEARYLANYLAERVEQGHAAYLIE